MRGMLGRARILVVARTDDLEITERDDATATREFHQRPPRDAQAVTEAHDGKAVASVGLLVPTGHGVGERSTNPQQASCLLHGVQHRRLDPERIWLPNGAHVA